jgi:hypothetical protein
VSPVPSFNAVARALFQRCTTPEDFSHAKSPATIRCRPSPLRLSLLQVSSNNAVPHRTGGRRATPGAAGRCKQSKQPPREDRRLPTGGPTSRLGVGNPLNRWHTTGSWPPSGVTTKSRLDTPIEANGASKAMPPKKLRRPEAPPSPVQKLDRVFTRIACNKIVAQRWRPQQGERRPWAPPQTP